MSARRAVLAVVAAVTAAALVVVAVLAWRRGTRSYAFPTAAGPEPVTGTVYSGPWLLLAVGAVTLAALLVVLVAGTALRRR